MIKDAPHLRIIDDNTWDRAQALKTRYASLVAPRQRRPKHIFSGMVKCAKCGGSYIVTGTDRLGCRNFRETGTCANRRSVKISAMEDRILNGIKARLLAPDMVKAYVAEYHTTQAELRNRERALHEQNRRRLSDTETKIANIVAAIESGGDAAPLANRLRVLEAERQTLEGRVEGQYSGGGYRDAPGPAGRVPPADRETSGSVERR